LDKRVTNPLWPVTAAAEWNKPFLRIGHGGASAHAPANSLRSIELAVAMGVDVVEFDVRPCRDGLVLIHDESFAGPDGASRLVADCDLADLPVPSSGDRIAALSEALDLVKGRALLNLDLKAAGCEGPVLDSLREKGMLGATLISSLMSASLRQIRAIEPRALTGYSYPEDKGGASGKPYLKPVVDAAIAAMRASLPYRLPGMIAEAQSNAVMLYHRVLSPASVRAVHALGAKAFVWTVDDTDLLRRMRAMGANGAASNHPELFASLT
jgi:glycerophosphoryl diester phosphodiesterase